MRKINILLVIALAVALAASFTFGQVGTVSAQGWAPTGVVVEYHPGQSITIVDEKGNHQQYMISSTVRILPPVRANAVEVGAFVTIISPASLNQGRQMAVGIVVHPHVPPGWNVGALTGTPPASGTAVETLTATAIGTPLASEAATESGTQSVTATATAAESPTETQLATDTATAAPMATETPINIETPTATPTATPTQIGGETSAPVDAFIAWLRSLFQQILTSR